MMLSEEFLQMLTPHLRRNSSSYLTSPTHRRYFALSCHKIVVFEIRVSFVQTALDDEMMSLSANVVDVFVRSAKVRKNHQPRSEK